MRVSDNGEVDALYIRLLEGDYQRRTLRWVSIPASGSKAFE